MPLPKNRIIVTYRKHISAYVTYILDVMHTHDEVKVSASGRHGIEKLSKIAAFLGMENIKVCSDEYIDEGIDNKVRILTFRRETNGDAKAAK